METKNSPDFLIENRIHVTEKNRVAFIEATEGLLKSLNGFGFKLDNQLLRVFERTGVVHKAWKSKILALDGGLEIMQKFCEISDKDDATGYTIPPPEINRFLSGFQRLMGWYDVRSFNQNARFENIEKFKITGIISSEWLTTLKEKEGGQSFLENFINDIDSASYAENKIVSGPKERRRSRKKLSENELIPKEYTSEILNKLKKLTQLSNKDLEELLDWPLNTFYAVRSGKGRLSIDDVQKISVLKNIPMEEILRIGEEMEKINSNNTISTQENTPEKSTTTKLTASVDISRKSDTELTGKIPIEIRAVLNKALLSAGEATIIGKNKEVFLGFLVLELQNYIISYSEVSGKLIITEKNGKGKFKIKNNELPF